MVSESPVEGRLHDLGVYSVMTLLRLINPHHILPPIP